MNASRTSGSTDQPVITIKLLDGFELLVGDEPVPVIPSSQRLLAFLALHGATVPRQTVAAAMWPQATAKRAATCLRSALWRLVKPPHPLIECGKDRLRVAAAVAVDVAMVRAFVAEQAAPPLRVPVTALAAELLPGWSEPWVEAEREWCRQTCLRALEVLSERFRVRGDYFRAHETALIELHLADGNPAAALRQYTKYQTLVRAELGVSPSPEIRSLVAPVFAGRQRV
jgi:DNA-binding SARP family transcriptional activator